VIAGVDPQILRAALTVSPTPLRARLQTQPPRLGPAYIRQPQTFRAGLQQQPTPLAARLQKTPDRFDAVLNPTGTGGGPSVDVELRRYVQKIMAVLDPNGPPSPNP
jgi:hypothetical protein